MTIVQWFLLTLASIVATCSAVMLTRKFVSSKMLQEHHHAIDPIMACVGTLFAILLGFMVANAMTRFEEARVNLQQEAGSIGNCFRLARALPKSLSITIMKECVQYIDIVCDEEFQLMEENKMSPKAQAVYSDLWKDCAAYEPKTQGQSNLHQALVESMTKLGECRRARTSEVAYRLPSILWFVVLAGAVTVVLFTLLFGFQSLPLQLALTSIVTAVIGLNIYLLMAFDSPFSGEVKVVPQPFIDNRIIYKEVLEEDLGTQKHVDVR